MMVLLHDPRPDSEIDGHCAGQTGIKFEKKPGKGPQFSGPCPAFYQAISGPRIF